MRGGLKHGLAGAAIRGAAIQEDPGSDSAETGPFKSGTDAMLREHLTAPRKQRHTGPRIWNGLVYERVVKVG